MKEKAYRIFLGNISRTNGMTVPLVPPPALNRNYKYVIGNGNNSILVRMALKQRWWWTNGDWEDFNFAWTQCRSRRAIAAAPRQCDKRKDAPPSADLES